MDTGVQEYVIADVAAQTAPLPVRDRNAVSNVKLNGRGFALGFETKAKPVRAGELVVGTLAVVTNVAACAIDRPTYLETLNAEQEALLDRLSEMSAGALQKWRRTLQDWVTESRNATSAA